MKDVATYIEEFILHPKKEKLISILKSVILGEEDDYIPEIKNPKYFEIWFYETFDFKYIVIGRNNFVIDINSQADPDLISDLFDRFKIDFDDNDKAEKEFSKLKQELEFKFFIECWGELEAKVQSKIRCFLIEHGIIRGIDVNKKEKIDGEKIAEILDDEGIPNHY